MGDVIKDPGKILVVDDDEDIVWMITSVLRKTFDVVSAPDGRKATELLKEERLVAVIADHMMPGMTGVALLDKAQELQPGAARVLITASERVNVLKDAVNLARVHRFLSKPLRLTELPQLMSNAIKEATLEVENIRLVQELELKNAELGRINEHLETQVQERTHELERVVEELRKMALRDGLTGLYNHRYFQESMEAEVARARRHSHTMGLLFIDVDHFKHYNDRNGHPAGDALLKRLAALFTGGRDSGLPRQGRLSDVAARYGGEEFVIILPETELQGCVVKAERIRASVEAHPFEHASGQPSGRVSVSIGVASFPHHGDDKQAVIDEADRQLYRAKHEGRNRVCVADGLPEADPE